MNRIIYKYTLEIEDEQKHILPRGAKILSVGNQIEKICVWVELEEGAIEDAEYTFFIRGTGHPFDDSALLQPTFLGTVLMAGGSLVWHVYYQKED